MSSSDTALSPASGEEWISKADAGGTRKEAFSAFTVVGTPSRKASETLDAPVSNVFLPNVWKGIALRTGASAGPPTVPNVLAPNVLKGPLEIHGFRNID